MSKKIKVIPYPKFVDLKSRKRVYLSNEFQILSNQKITTNLQLAIDRYSKYLSSLTGFTTKINENLLSTENRLIIDCPSTDSNINSYPKLNEDENYTLDITDNGSYLKSTTITGIIRGLSTFIQLIEREPSSDKFYLPHVFIRDDARFPWRGLLLDVSRHWMPLPVIERTLNAMELSKLNVLHLHLSDDQGFRVESIKYNLLHDKKDFFSQKDIRYIVEYAQQRRIRIIPEFDMPGHTTSWFVGYPNLTCEPGPYQVETRWGVMKPTMDPTKETTYSFLDEFFKEMTQLFPDPYFHIGGDEVEGSQWAQSSSIQQFILQNKLANKNGLQAYFNERIQTLLKNYGKTLIGWDEILYGISDTSTIDKDSIIHSWQNRASLHHAVKKGYRSILSNGYYIDHLSPSKIHYRNDPISENELKSLSESEQSRILGGEACMWSEFVSKDTVDSRIWPRVLAIAERLWSLPIVTDEYFLYERLFRMNYLLDRVQIGLTHLSSYQTKLENLITDEDKKKTLLHPFTILADVCEPQDCNKRSATGKYSTNVPLTTFTDALQIESEVIWKLETRSLDYKYFHDLFRTWSINHLRLRKLFDDLQHRQNLNLWGQNIQQLSINLAHVATIGLRILNYRTRKILHEDKNNTMNSWSLSHWIEHHHTLLNELENEVTEVRLAAVRPVRRLLSSIPMNQIIHNQTN